MWQSVVVILLSVALGFVCGYGVRAAISHHHRAQAQRLGITRGSPGDAAGPAALKDDRQDFPDHAQVIQPVTDPGATRHELHSSQDEA